MCLYKLYFLFHRGLAVGIYATNSPEACHYVAENCEANVIVVENKHQLHKILQVCKLLCNWFTFKMMDIHAGSRCFYGMLSYTVIYDIIYISSHQKVCLFYILSSKKKERRGKKQINI